MDSINELKIKHREVGHRRYVTWTSMLVSTVGLIQLLHPYGLFLNFFSLRTHQHPYHVKSKTWNFKQKWKVCIEQNVCKVLCKSYSVHVPIVIARSSSFIMRLDLFLQQWIHILDSSLCKVFGYMYELERTLVAYTQNLTCKGRL
jgi:hypothetical protein